MRLGILMFIFICFKTAAFNQVIEGTVTDYNTNNAIFFASIYFDGTFAGTHSDEQGYFELDVSEFKSMPLTVSALGYYTLKVTDFLSGKPVNIIMRPRIFELGEVTIHSKDSRKIRKENLRLFREAFLGVTQNASQTRILNENVIYLYDLGIDTLAAISRGPIEIRNRALGYAISYFLDDFILNKKNKNFYFTGTILFKKDLGTGKITSEYYERNRSFAYFGSKMQFFRSLWRNSSDSAGFKIRDKEDKNLHYNDIVNEGFNQMKILKYNSDLVIYYHSAIPVGLIRLLDQAAYFDQSGYFNPSSIAWDGKMAQQRIADQLPYEYSIAEQK